MILPTITVSPFMSPSNPDDDKPATAQQNQQTQQQQTSTPAPAPQPEPEIPVQQTQQPVSTTQQPQQPIRKLDTYLPPVMPDYQSIGMNPAPLIDNEKMEQIVSDSRRRATLHSRLGSDTGDAVYNAVNAIGDAFPIAANAVAKTVNGQPNDNTEATGNDDSTPPSPGSTFFGRDWQTLRDKATSDSQFVAELQAGLLPKEEQEKRERAARRINGIQHLGNMLSAFSNLYYTRGGAPSQTLPTIKDPDLETWRTNQRKNITSYQDWVDKKDKAIWDREYKLMTAAHRQEMDKVKAKRMQADIDAKEAEKRWNDEKNKWAVDSAKYKAEQAKYEAAKKEAEARKAEEEALAAKQKADDAHAVAMSTANKNNAEAQAAAVKAAAAAKEAAARAEKARAEAAKAKSDAQVNQKKANTYASDVAGKNEYRKKTANNNGKSSESSSSSSPSEENLVMRPVKPAGQPAGTGGRKAIGGVVKK